MPLEAALPGQHPAPVSGKLGTLARNGGRHRASAAAHRLRGVRLRLRGAVGKQLLELFAAEMDTVLTGLNGPV